MVVEFAQAGRRMIRHFGVFKFPPDINEIRIAECFAAMEGMVGKIVGLLEFEHGPYQSDKV